jgi:hypothetical protein
MTTFMKCEDDKIPGKNKEEQIKTYKHWQEVK